MFRKTALGLLAIVTLLAASTGTASAYYGHHRGGYGYGYRGGCGYGYGYRGYYAPRVYAPPVYAYPPAVGVVPNYNYGPYYGAGYAQPGFGVTTPGLGVYVR